MKHYEKDLPQGYVEAKTIDAANKKTGIVLNALAFLITFVTFAVIWLILFRAEPIGKSIERIRPEKDWHSVVAIVVFIVGEVCYMVLHELVHGVSYKLFTKQKLKFGLTLTCAFCGVPDIYVYRTASLVSVLAPFVIFIPVFLIPMFFIPSYLWIVLFALLLSIHVGGCVGDLYDACLFAFRFRDKRTLMRDTGPKQTVYVPQDSKIGQKLAAQKSVVANKGEGSSLAEQTAEDCGAADKLQCDEAADMSKH
ncbi:MAG: DUF3267 domain-containing protein [Corallococcus sp.]|nr:DUF3267 domain-containing protein [Corallococcus sp.]MCM1360036.1 DUF3267 domain-containing protein [Corallococcus sp.]MCM1395593.1 DUF3267 domain-containing protein [Corallococcus sp.]